MENLLHLYIFDRNFKFNWRTLWFKTFPIVLYLMNIDSTNFFQIRWFFLTNSTDQFVGFVLFAASVGKAQWYKEIWDPPSTNLVSISPFMFFSPCHSSWNDARIIHPFIISIILLGNLTSCRVSSMNPHSSLSYAFFTSILTIFPPFFPVLPFKEWIISGKW